MVKAKAPSVALAAVAWQLVGPIIACFLIHGARFLGAVAAVWFYDKTLWEL